MKILIVEDDENLLEGIVRTLRRAKWDVDYAHDASSAVNKIGDIDLLVTDIRMPGMDGIQLLREARKKRPKLEVIIMTGYGSIPSAVEAIKEGARAYLTKPFDIEELLVHLREVKKLFQFKETAEKPGRGGLVGSSPIMRDTYSAIDVASSSDAPVLITGETGAGKDLAARAIHDSSARKGGPFVAINLGALPSDLIEGELFGHEKGAFTGALSRKLGRFSVADGGTLFLDEIDSLPVALQPKLLRTIEKKEIWPLGAEKNQTINVRIIAASNAVLEDMILNQTFREDLYYRLNVLRINMPPLRRHPEDIPQITRALLERIASNLSLDNIEITAECLSHLITQPWKGNVRELSNVLERATAKIIAGLGPDPNSRKSIILDASSLDIPAALPTAQHPCPPTLHEVGEGGADDGLPFKAAKIQAADNWANNTIREVLSKFDGNVSQAARHLKMSRTALIRLINKYNIRS